MVSKKDEFGGKSDFRFVVDYRKLNLITENHDFPIPLIDDILNGLSGCEFFSTLDIKGAFHQIEMEKNSRDYTSFTVGNFKYRWLRMPMGLTSAPLTWQTILIDLIGNGVFVYLDDVIICTRTRKEHEEILWKTMTLLRQHNLQMKISKCYFFARQFEYLGHIITVDGTRANPKKIEVIKNYPRPMTVKQIQSFLGLCNYFRRYVRDYSRISKPLTTLLKKEQPFVWTSLQQNSFDRLKQALANEVTLAFPSFQELFYCTTDASDVALSGVLSQGELPNDRPIYFFSKTLNEAQKRYSATEKELLAIVEAIKAFRVYLYGRFFVLITDHKALCYLFNMKDCGSRLFRQKLELSEYNFKILYRPGARNNVAGALPRIEPVSIDEMLQTNEQKCCALTRAQKKLVQPQEPLDCVDEKDGTILSSRNYDLVFHLVPLETDTLKNRLINKFGVSKISNEWQIHNKVHYMREISNQFSSRQNSSATLKCINEIQRICNERNAKSIAINIDFDNIRHYYFFKNSWKEIFDDKMITTTFFLNKILTLTEKEDIDYILNLYHNTLLGAHVGGEKMHKTISKFYTWNNMTQGIKDYVKKCEVCTRTKVTTNTRMPMEISSLGESLFDHTYIDFVGPIPQSVGGHKYIFTAICDLTKFLVAVPTVDSTAITAAGCLLENVLCRYNFPSRLISDNASDFTSRIIRELSNLFMMKKIFTTPYHPQANIVERAHRTLNAYIRAFTTKNRDERSTLSKYATFAYNNTVHSVTGFTPHELAHGFKIRIPNHLTKSKVVYNYENFADLTRNNIAKALELAKDHLYEKKIQNKKYYDRKLNEIDLIQNDMVLIKNSKKKHKFDDVYQGPYKIINIYDKYVEVLRGNKRVKIHKNLIKKANVSNT